MNVIEDANEAKLDYVTIHARYRHRHRRHHHHHHHHNHHNHHNHHHDDRHAQQRSSEKAHWSAIKEAKTIANMPIIGTTATTTTTTPLLS